MNGLADYLMGEIFKMLIVVGLIGFGLGVIVGYIIGHYLV